jgi:phage terminase large subunit
MMTAQEKLEIIYPHKFKCRPYQIDAWKELDSGRKRVVCSWHRGAGKDLFALNYLIWKALEVPAVYLHCFPKYNQGKRAIWNSVHQTDVGEAISYLDHFPKEAVKYKNSSDMRLELVNGSIYCVMGLDGKNATQARGMNPSFIILSEYAYMDPESWYTIEPRISQNRGTAIFLSTPNGQNHFYSLCNYASRKENPDYFYSHLTIDDTKILDASHIEKLRGEGIPEDFIQQEYYCSFTRGAEGSYYGKYIQAARDDERITSLHLHPDLPVHSGWDIGIGDSTAVWLFQILPNGKINFVHYYENNNEGLDHYLRYLDDWKCKKGAIFGTHFVPHDMQNREYTSGVDRITTARQLGYPMLAVPRTPVDEGIQAVRSTLNQCSFDAKLCERGIKCLDFYRKKWNESLKVYYDTPLHDQWSHGADAFRTAIVGMKHINPQSVNKLSAESIKEMRQRNLGY